jgi:phosphoserine phosphatase
MQLFTRPAGSPLPAAASRPSAMRLDVIDPDGKIGPTTIRGFALAQLGRRIRLDLVQSRQSDSFFVPLSLYRGRFSLIRLLQIRRKLNLHMKGSLNFNDELYEFTKQTLAGLPLETMAREYFHAERRPEIVQQLINEFMKVPPAMVNRVVVTAGIKPMARPISDMIGARNDFLIATEVVDEMVDGKKRLVDIRGKVEDVPYGRRKRDHVRARLEIEKCEAGTFYFSSPDSLWVALDHEIPWEKIVLLDPPNDLIRAMKAFQKGHRRLSPTLAEPILHFFEKGGKKRTVEILKGGLVRGERGVWSEEKQDFVFEKVPPPSWVKHIKTLSRIHFNPPATYAELRRSKAPYGSFFELAEKYNISPSEMVFLMDMEMTDYEEGTATDLKKFFQEMRRSHAARVYMDTVGVRQHMELIKSLVRLGPRAGGSSQLNDPAELYRKIQVLFTARDMFRLESLENRKEMIAQAATLSVYRPPEELKGEEKQRTIDDELLEFAEVLALETGNREERLRILENMKEREFVGRIGRRFGVDYFYENELRRNGDASDPISLIRSVLERRGDKGRDRLQEEVLFKELREEFRIEKVRAEVVSKGEPQEDDDEDDDSETEFKKRLAYRDPFDWRKWTREKFRIGILPGAPSDERTSAAVLEPTRKKTDLKKVATNALREAGYGAGSMVGAMAVVSGGTVLTPEALSIGFAGAVWSAALRPILGHHPAVRALYTTATFLTADFIENSRLSGAAAGVSYTPLAVFGASTAADAAFGFANRILGSKLLTVRTDNWKATVAKGAAHAAATLAILHALQVFF